MGQQVVSKQSAKDWKTVFYNNSSMAANHGKTSLREGANQNPKLDLQSTYRLIVEGTQSRQLERLTTGMGKHIFGDTSSNTNATDTCCQKPFLLLIAAGDKQYFVCLEEGRRVLRSSAAAP